MGPRPRHVLAPLLCYLSVLAALMAWHAFVIDPRAYFWKAAGVGLVVAATGIVLRWRRLPMVAVLGGQLVLGWCATGLAIAGAPIPFTSGQRHHLVAVFDSAATTVMQSDVPVSAGHGGVAPYLVCGAAISFLLADLLASTLRRPTFVGLVLLAIFSVTLSLTGGGVDWWVFALTAAAFLSLLFLDEGDRLAHWGRPLDDRAGAGIATDGADPRAPLTPGPGAIAATATALAIVVPALIPTLHLDLNGFGSGGHGPIRVTNPTVGMYDSLRDQSDTPLVQVRRLRGANVEPAYLRIAALTTFDGSEWRPGDRVGLRTLHSSAHFDPPQGDPTLLGASTTYSLEATADFQAGWLPTFMWTTSVDAGGSWGWDEDTQDFIASDNQTVQGMSWTVTTAPVDPSKVRLLAAPAGSSGVSSRYLELPGSHALDPRFGTIAHRLTARETTVFEKAVALQDWFHDSGGFTYSTERPIGTDGNALYHFVTDQKIGFCQQFATAMAAMAREIGIPSRVAVGFARGEATGDGWVFRARDMHAWPELWFEGVGWVPFEPTPPRPGQVNPVPDYTVGVLEHSAPGVDPSKSPPTQPRRGADRGRQHPTLPNKRPAATTNDTGATRHRSDHTALVAWTSTLGGLAFLGALLSIPASVRRRRRRRRLAGGPEEGWAELRDTAIDLRLPWSDRLSPRACAAELRPSVCTAPARAALDRLVVAVERSRYSQRRSAEPVGADVRTVVERLADGVDRRTRRWALMWPRSVMTRPRRSVAAVEPEPVERHLVDHI